MDSSKGKKAGRPKGIAREGKYGTGIKTKVVRLPVLLADNIEDTLDKLESIKSLILAWKNEISNSPTSPRYDKAKVMLEELEGLMNN